MTSLLTSSGPASGRLSGGCFPTRTSGCSTASDLARLREVTASQGLMLESVSERLMETVHAGSPTKHPTQRLATIEAAGELRIPFTSGILVGIGETEEEQVASLEALAELHGATAISRRSSSRTLLRIRSTTGRKWLTSPMMRRVSAGDRRGPLRRGSPPGAGGRGWRWCGSRVPAGGDPGGHSRLGHACVG